VSYIKYSNLNIPVYSIITLRCNGRPRFREQTKTDHQDETVYAQH